MFGINKLFKKNNSDRTRLYEVLEAYKSGVFPVGIEREWVENYTQCHDGITLALQIPFAVKSVNSCLTDYLTKQLGQSVKLTIDVKLPDVHKYKAVKHILLVASGKGGVGKSTTAAFLAQALSAEGGRVGILDADIYGPSIPTIFGVRDAKPTSKDNKTLNPIIKDEISIQSIGFLVPAENATVWRGPMASQALNQLLNETEWGELDYLIVDMPPGTGDIQLTMTQKVPASGALIVTTPQDLALADAQKGIAMFNQVNLPTLGLIENMSHFLCGHCGEKNHIFGQHGGADLASRHGVPLIAEVPLDINIRETSEQGENILTASTEQAANYVACAQLVGSILHYQTQSTSTVDIVITDD
ncbi:Mrp/NBP35 family ATP-binding protein [Pseudoalteromonas aurantia]|uniref:Iron-sulfur cluster carrier protein n=1 Tax=Pseudoalteromonas aurantia TaxID=43654 RepID=A0A5S3V8G3_9GAMM|nr:Mrp/NBP35 family ATP-binding protein [Pseudoalteromonas aurantia]TMO58611.1 sodium:proton antiporter [Pseudoalteromonas aurantia]TMO68002.1 sodium:proton antiporter [Pseudoalteromonas aurantia]TMO73951.1 sodium:proton antiporter [Pseudoalteromonas aurantia]